MTGPAAVVPGREPLWVRAATNPGIEVLETRAAEAHELRSAIYVAGCRMDDFYWNTGVPYTTHLGRPGGDAMRLSFGWDRPDDSGGDRRGRLRPRSRARWLNDRDIPFDDVRPSGHPGISVGRAAATIRPGDGRPGTLFLIRDVDSKVISPGYSSMSPVGNGNFVVPDWSGRPVTLHLLSAEERKVVLAARAHLDHLQEIRGDVLEESARSRDLTAEIITSLFRQEGIEAEDNDRCSNASTFWFDYAGKRVMLTASDAQMSVLTWDAAVTRDQLFALWGAWDEQRGAPVISIPRETYDTTGLDAFRPEAGGPLKSFAGDDEVSFDTETFHERFGVVEFTAQTPHASWALPIVLALVAQPTDVATQLTERTLGGSSVVTVQAPGLFTLGRDDRGIAQIVMGETMPPDLTGQRERVWSIGAGGVIEAVPDGPELARTYPAAVGASVGRVLGATATARQRHALPQLNGSAAGQLA